MVRTLTFFFLGLTLLLGVTVMAAMSALAGAEPQGTEGYDPNAVAVADIPPLYLQLYRQAGQTYGIDWAILAGIGKVETDHGRLKAPGVTSGVNSYGCCAGPMQFDLRGTWPAYGQGGNIYDPRDAIPAAARYLVASGAPKDYHRAILAYNHAEWYVAKVLAQAEAYRGALRQGQAGPVVTDGALRAILDNPRITLTPGQRIDIQQPGMDARLLAVMAWIGKRHSYLVTALRRDHPPGTNHEAGRAFDVGIVDGHVCINATPRDPCGHLAVELTRLPDAYRPTELIACFDADGPDPRSFYRADHCDHDHVGWDLG